MKFKQPPQEPEDKDPKKVRAGQARQAKAEPVRLFVIERANAMGIVPWKLIYVARAIQADAVHFARDQGIHIGRGSTFDVTIRRWLMQA